MRPRWRVLVVGVVAGVASTILQLPAISVWRHARFTIGALVIAVCLTGGYFGAPTSRKRDGMLGGIGAVIVMLALSGAAHLLQSPVRDADFLDLIPGVVFLIAFGAVGGVIGAKLRSRPAGQLSS